MAEVDIDHNGKLDIVEFIVFMSKVLNVHFDNMEELKIAFRVFDANGDGKISKDELRFTFRIIFQSNYLIAGANNGEEHDQL